MGYSEFLEYLGENKDFQATRRLEVGENSDHRRIKMQISRNPRLVGISDSRESFCEVPFFRGCSRQELITVVDVAIATFEDIYLIEIKSNHHAARGYTGRHPRELYDLVNTQFDVSPHIFGL